MKKHWTKNLHEVGIPITNLGDYQERRLQTIQRLEAEIARILKEYADEEIRIETIVLNPDPAKGWTPQEVNAAKHGTSL